MIARRMAYLIGGAAAALALILAFDLVPFLRGDFGWRWPYVPVAIGRVLPLALMLILYLAGLIPLLRAGRRGLPVVLWSFAGALLIPLAVIAARADDVLFALLARTASGITTGPHLASAEIDWAGGVWAGWLDVMAGFEGRSVHVLLSPPGLPLFHALINGAFDALPALADPLQWTLLPYQCHNYALLRYTPGQWAGLWWGILMPLWAALSVVPLYGLACRLAGGRAAALAVSGWPLVPALALFAPVWNTFYPLIALLAFWVFDAGLARGPLHRGGLVRMMGAGLLVGLLTFANFSIVPLVGLFGFYTALHRFGTPPGRAWALRVIVGAWFGLGLVLPWALFWLAGGLTPFDLLAFAMDEHLSLDRPYLPWLWLHTWEWALLGGLPFIVVWIIGAARARRGLGLALLLTLIVLVLSGTARGETGRVWLFFVPFALIAAAGYVDVARHWLALSGGAAALLLALGATWAVIDAPDIVPPPTPPGPVAAGQPVSVAFGEAFTLDGWDATLEDGAVNLRLNWRALEPMTTPYWFSALLVGPDGAPVGTAQVWQPLATRYPTTCWAVGDPVGEVVSLPLPADTAAGGWWVSVAAFADEADPEDRLPVRLADGTVDNQIGLGPVLIAQP